MTPYDIIIIGSGPGGYSAAVRAAQLGYRTAIVEKYASLGGTCTNVGCIPSKALLDATENYHSVHTKFSAQGIEIKNLTLNFSQLMEHKKGVVRQNLSGLKYLMKKNKIEVIRGTATFVNSREIRVEHESTANIYSARHFIIATGSKPATIPGVTIDKKRIITSTEALSLPEKPGSMVIIGGGVIGVEMASIYARIGVQVTILEYMDSLIPAMDHDLGRELKRIFQKEGIRVLLKKRVTSVSASGEKVTVHFDSDQEDPDQVTADYCLVATGRKPYTEGLGLENTAIQLDERGRIQTNEKLQTREPHIYAIGDVIAGPMLAHKAEEDAVFGVETIHGQQPHLNYHLVPGVVYTWPEVAGVGYTEEQLKAKGIAYNVGKFPFSASGRARAAIDTQGFTKVLTDPKYGEVLGVHIIGARAADLIAQAVIGLHYEITDEDMFRISYAHPTYSETLKEAYLISSGQGAINI
ncbi:dihydrolipoyl dehydrogenase [Flavilitoribacter nigricans]|uniref:Dihydrolipoyl dehydrogenase n=1 Tax=Flavilitoribacter nigricans (strain ATCC 23147 / DSM 23189 / NBRC 102662 / NCIMB 1420 / SS-2) TaxID=1122177 RepID=A0A2D0N548_FLAN2|nr:dihydrolipoyl dehydrogenase [Flavilitoribacter nigricans]PHN03518.1 dihydrolipoyl dehydrogenase [Flavilitoribacter nigricans DSM 23189 = NBRC 102662]